MRARKTFPVRATLTAGAITFGLGALFTYVASSVGWRYGVNAIPLGPILLAAGLGAFGLALAGWLHDSSPKLAEVLWRLVQVIGFLLAIFGPLIALALVTPRPVS